MSVVGKQFTRANSRNTIDFRRPIATTQYIWLTTRRGGPKALPETRRTQPSLALHVAQAFIPENHRGHPKNGHIGPNITCTVPRPWRRQFETPIFSAQLLVPRPNPTAQNTFATELNRHAPAAYPRSQNSPSLLETGIIHFQLLKPRWQAPP